MAFMIVLKENLLWLGQINFVHVPVVSSALVNNILAIFTTTVAVKWF